MAFNPNLRSANFKVARSARIGSIPATVLRKVTTKVVDRWRIFMPPMPVVLMASPRGFGVGMAQRALLLAGTGALSGLSGVKILQRHDDAAGIVIVNAD